MNNASGHLAILGGAGIAAVLVSGFMLWGWPGDSRESAHATVVVTLPPRAEPAAAPMAPSKPPPAATAHSGTDPASLARALQRELKRVGCYEGEITGIWNASSRSAMKFFTERVNASLPVDAPDQVLLALVQGHREPACGGACKADEQPGADGRCVPKVFAAKAERANEPRSALVPEKAEPAIVPVPMPIPAARPQAIPKVETGIPATAARLTTAPQSTKAEAPSAAAQSQPEERNTRHAGPVPPAGIYERRARREVRRSSPRPPPLVRSFIYNLKRAASVW